MPWLPTNTNLGLTSGISPSSLPTSASVLLPGFSIPLTDSSFLFLNDRIITRTATAKYKDVLPALCQEQDSPVSSFCLLQSQFLLLQQHKEVTENQKFKPSMAG